MIKESKKDLIADSALSCFMNSGYNNTSVDEIVRASGVSKGGIYWHFKGKEDIFIYIVERQMARWLSQYLNSLDEKDSASDKLTKYIEHRHQNIDTPISVLMSEFFMQTKDQEVIKKIYFLAVKKQTVLREIIAEAVNVGEFRFADIDAVTSTFVAMFDGFMHQWMINRDKQLLEHNSKVALDIFFKGLKIN